MNRFALHFATPCLIAALLGGCGGDDKPSARDQVEDIVASVERPVERLDDAVGDARPRSRASLVSLRAAAERAADRLDDAESELRSIDATSASDRELVRNAGDAVDELNALATALSVSPPSPGRIEQASEQAQLAIDDLEELSMPEVDATAFASALRANRRRPRAPDPQTGQPSTPVGPTSPPSGGGSAPGYRDYVGPAFQAKLPTGSGWGAPAQSEPTPGRLYRTSVRGPNETFVIVDYTPFETAKFGGSYRSRETVGQTAFGAATKYVFSGGRIAECQRFTCVDYIINDVSSGEGFAVLAGGPDIAVTEQIARTVAESVTPVDE